MLRVIGGSGGSCWQNLQIQRGADPRAVETAAQPGFPARFHVEAVKGGGGERLSHISTATYSGTLGKRSACSRPVRTRTCRIRQCYFVLKLCFEIVRWRCS